MLKKTHADTETRPYIITKVLIIFGTYTHTKKKGLKKRTDCLIRCSADILMGTIFIVGVIRYSSFFFFSGHSF